MTSVRRSALKSSLLLVSLMFALFWTSFAIGGVPVGSNPDNPLTIVGERVEKHRVLIIWPDRKTSVVDTTQPATRASIAQIVKDQAVVEGRPPSDSVLAGELSRRTISSRRQVGYGTTACSYTLYIYKSGPSSVTGGHISACTWDVIWQGASLELYRSQSWTPIASGWDDSDGPNLHANTQEGQCLQSTWQYNLHDNFYVDSSVNGSAGFFLGFGPAWISC